MPPTAPPTSDAALPAGYSALRERTRPGAIGRMVEAERRPEVGAPQRVALRLQPADRAQEWLAELVVLSAIAHPGLARLLDFGAAPGGGVYAARSWIDGVELPRWAPSRSPLELARVVARLCVALEHLHARGFVHGDLKASNVIVVERDGEALPVLTDFGLSRARGAGAEGVSGTLFHIAPEVLLGAPLRPAADLFALGVMLHELTVARRPTAREFYGRFPGCDFFEATRTSAEELPELLRENVTALLERDPSRRSASAAQVGRAFAQLAGLEGLFRERGVELHWPTLFGREEWLARWSQRVSASGDAVRRHWLALPAGEDARGVVDACALHLALRGGASAALRVQRWDCRARIETLGGVDALDRWARESAEQHGNELVLVALDEATPWTVRALDAFALAALQAPVDRRPAGVVVAAHVAAPDSQAAWARDALAPVDAASVERFLRERTESSGVALGPWAAEISRAAGGAASRVELVLAELIRRGHIVAGERAPRLRSVAAPTIELEADRAVWPQDSDATALLAALHVATREADFRELGELAQLEGDALEGAASKLAEAGAASWERGADGVRLRASSAQPPNRGAFGEARWRELHARRAAQLERSGADARAVLPHAFRAGLVGAHVLVARCEELREIGAAELALQLADAAVAMRREAGAAVESELEIERVLAWCALGDADRAEELLDALGDAQPLAQGAQAARLRARGQIASTRRDLQTALGFFERARALDPTDGGLALLATARALGEANRDAEWLDLLERVRQGDAELASLRPRVRENLLAREALALFRAGDAATARERLARFADDARAAGDTAREAGLRINLATVERRAGGLQRALEHFERAIELYERSGNLLGLAQARAQYGGALRESGELLRAQPLLEASLALRERLGDRSGATSVRGMLGLLLADRGHARAAVVELERTAAALRVEGRSQAAVLLEARASEVRARCGETPRLDSTAAGEAARAAEGDPRILLAHARALAFRGEPALARERLERAAALAERLGLAPLAREARLVAEQLSGRPSAAPAASSEGADLAAEDARLFYELGLSTLDAPNLRRCAADLRARGRDDRAARVSFALAARGAGEHVESDAHAADESFGACARGLAPAEQAHLRRALLGVPDPWPEDLIAHERRRSAPEDDEMEVIGLLDINRRLLAQEDLRSLLGTIVEQSLQASGAQRGFLILEEDGELKVDTALDSRRGDLEAPDVEVSGSVLREALEKMRPIRVSNAVDDPQLGAAPSVIHLELRSILCVPFEVQAGLRGVIYVDHRLREAAFDARVERVLSLLANQAALAILQVRRLEEIRRLNRELGRQVARKDSDLKSAAAALRRANLPTPGAGLVGESEPLRAVRRLLERAAPSNLPVLVSGPSGSGKELAARALHELSQRRDGPFVSENCAALPPSLIEAELFGARRGAYTGADRDREGLFERAHGGTLFLDELGELPLDLQAKLLRVLETSEVRRIGDDKLRKVDVRLVAATNRDLALEVNEKRFRADLYYRLNGLSVAMPSLAERPEDIPALVDHCLRLNAEPGKPPRGIAPAVVTRLCRRAWPGNVRELFNEVARLLVMSEGDVVDPELVRGAQTLAAPAATAGGVVRKLDELEKEAILHALETAGGDKRKAAELLGISRAKVYQRLKDWGLSEPEEGK
jgi:serine/threonine-protein kinase PknK